MQDQSNEVILSEIQIKPSKAILENRFAAGAIAHEAKCTGRCESGGGCKPFLDLE